MTSSPRGFTILEAMIAMGVLAFAAAGALAGIIAASRDIRSGQMRQFEAVLVDAKLQREMVSNKDRLLINAQTAPATPPDTIGIGLSPWVPDPEPRVVGDLSTGAYFTLTANGTVAHNTLVPPGTACNAAALPAGTYCRETLLVQGMSVPLSTHAGAVPNLSQPMTQWIRVSRKGDTLEKAVVHRQVLIQ